ncbi:MAG: type II toxin-antitoxin system RelE/ParE family toxin [Flavobacteriales bacterium]
MAEVNWSRSAQRDLHAIHDRIAADSLLYAKRFIARIESAADQLGAYPGKAHPVPDFGLKHIRQVNIGDYRLIYLDLPQGVYIARIYHSARLLRIIHLK